jgi:hypothetical protein
MGLNNPQALVSNIWFNNCMHFGLRGGKEQRELKWETLLSRQTLAGKNILNTALKDKQRQDLETILRTQGQ